MSTLRVDNIVPYTNGSTTVVLTGTLEATASYALTASYAMNGEGGTPGGSDTQIQFNSGSTFAGDNSFTYNYTNYSLQHGQTTNAIGEYSHAEGISTKTGTQNAFSASIVNGIITLSGSYGDVASQFTIDNRLYLYDEPFDNSYTRAIFNISQSYFDDTNTIVELYETYVNTTTAYVGNLNWLSANGSWNGDQTIPANYSHAEGYYATVLGNNSHAEGRYTVAAGDFAHAEGNRTQALNDYSHAEGRLTIASRWQSHAEGNRTYAGGISSHAEGDRTVALGEGSHAEGNSTIASGSYQHVSGQYNQHNNTDSLFVVGIGLNNDTRKDGFSVDIDEDGKGSIMIPTNDSDHKIKNPKTGSIYINFEESRLWAYDGTNWRSVVLDF